MDWPTPRDDWSEAPLVARGWAASLREKTAAFHAALGRRGLVDRLESAFAGVAPAATLEAGASPAEAAAATKAAEEHLRAEWLPHPVPVVWSGHRLSKRAADPYLRYFTQAIGATPGFVTKHPNPAISILAGGLLGAGAGYGSGLVAETLFPALREGKARRRFALWGAALGAAPGLAAGFLNRAEGRPFTSGEIFSGRVPVAPPVPPLAKRPLREVVPPELWTDKRANWGAPGAAAGDEGFDAAQFQHALWRDPAVASRLTGAERALASGLVADASRRAGSSWITPVDLAETTAALGSGYLSGMVVGKVLGVLVGLPEAQQSRLRELGAWSGVVSSLLPRALGG